MIRISVSTGLNQFKDCPRCFWLHYNKGIKRPAGIFPSLPNGMDRIIKQHFDKFRANQDPLIKGLPVYLSSIIKGDLVDKNLIDNWRDWRTGLEYKYSNNVTLIGALDDCGINKNKYIPLDYKTKGSPPNNGDGEKYYQLQLDTYSLLLDENGYPTAGYAYLIYYSPSFKEDFVRAKGNINYIEFQTDILKVKVNPKRAKIMLKKAIECLDDDIPEASSNCIYCNFIKQRKDY